MYEGVQGSQRVRVGQVGAALAVLPAIVQEVLGLQFVRPLVASGVAGLCWVPAWLVSVGPDLVGGAAAPLVCYVGTKRYICRKLGTLRSIVQILARPMGATCRRSCVLRCSWCRK